MACFLASHSALARALPRLRPPPPYRSNSAVRRLLSSEAVHPNPLAVVLGALVGVSRPPLLSSPARAGSCLNPPIPHSAMLPSPVSALVAPEPALRVGYPAQAGLPLARTRSARAASLLAGRHTCQSNRGGPRIPFPLRRRSFRPARQLPIKKARVGPPAL
jgi:hypothetical protein